MERDFVYLIKFKLFIVKEEFENYKSYIDEIEYNENKK